MNEQPHQDLNAYELADLVSSQTNAVNRQRIARLVAELRRLREEAGEREKMAAQEVEW